MAGVIDDSPSTPDSTLPPIASAAAPLGAAESALKVEQDVVDHIQAIHTKHVEAARATATRLAGDAAEATEDGIRDLVDEDAEADTAIRAALVRQTSNRAIQAFRRLTDLEMAGDALAFGRITVAADWAEGGPDADKAGHEAGRDHDPETLYIGRLSVLDGDDVLLVDWRARAAAAFYQATPVDRQGVSHRRHLNYGDGVTVDATRLIGYSDEVFDLASVDAPETLRGEAAILAALEAPTEAQMRSVVATIQAEQDRIVRAPSSGALVVQGGPGTGKTVVALHRAAYLLYNQRAALAENGVLIVGPTTEFLAYIGGVLPSLGETGVVSVTANQLFGDIRLGHEEPAETHALKGQVKMADLLTNAVRNRQRTPKEDLVAWYGSDRVKLPIDDLLKHFETAQRYRTHNQGAEVFRAAIIDAFVAQVYDQAFQNYEDAYRTFASSRDIRMFLMRHWPTLTPEQALNDLFGSTALLRLAATDTDISDGDQNLLERARTPEAQLWKRRWAEADVPLLDELLALVGIVGENNDEARIEERDERTVFEVAEARDEEGWDDDEDDADGDDSEDGPSARAEEGSSSLGDQGYAMIPEEDFGPINPLPREGWMGGEQLG